MLDAPSPDEAAGGVLAITEVAAGVFAEERGSFQKLEELADSALTTSFPLSAAAAVDKEPFEGERVSQVAALLFGAGLWPSAFSPWDLSDTAPSLTVALREVMGFFLSLGLISAGSSKTSCLSRPIIHHEPEDLTLTDSVFLSSISPIKVKKQLNQLDEEGQGGWGGEGTDDVQPMFLIAILNLFQSHR
jgi:hypothetical protein